MTETDHKLKSRSFLLSDNKHQSCGKCRHYQYENHIILKLSEDPRTKQITYMFTRATASTLIYLRSHEEAGSIPFGHCMAHIPVQSVWSDESICELFQS